MKINPVSKTCDINLNYNTSEQQSQYKKNKKYKCPHCGKIFDELLEILNINSEEEQAIIKQKMIERGYEIGV